MIAGAATAETAAAAVIIGDFCGTSWCKNRVADADGGHTD